MQSPWKRPPLCCSPGAPGTCCEHRFRNSPSNQKSLIKKKQKTSVFYWKLFFEADRGSYLQEGPNCSLKLVRSHADLLLAEVHKAARAQRGLQPVGALQKGRFRDDLTDVNNVGRGLLRLRRPRVLQRHQLPSKLREKNQTRNTECKRWRFPLKNGAKLLGLTAKEAPTGLRIHLGGFFRGLTVAGAAGVCGSCSGGSGCPVPNGSRFPKELLI